MKRMFDINIGGEAYKMTYTLRTFRAVSDKFGSPDKMREAMNAESALEAIEAQIFVLHQLILAGARLSTMYGEEARTITLEKTRAVSGLMHISKLKDTLIAVIAAASTPSIEALPATKKKTTRRGITVFEHYLWQGLHIGLDYNTALDIPFGELLSLIGEEAIQNGAKERIRNSQEDVIPDWD